MKAKYFNYLVPIGMGLVLTTITIFSFITASLVSCDKLTNCAAGQCAGTNGHCYSCSAGSYCTTTPTGNCSAPTSGVYCCTGSGGGGGGGGGCNNGCKYPTPWRCGSYCYSTPPSGNHSCTKCP